MLRTLAEILVPLLLPTLLYLGWVWGLNRLSRSPVARQRGLPWLWLAGAGVVLVVVVLVATIGFGTPQRGVYVPPRWQNGKIIPGHIDPGRAS